MIVAELIEKLKKFNPDGDAEVISHYHDNDPEFTENIGYITMEEDRDGKLVVVLNTIER